MLDVFMGRVDAVRRRRAIAVLMVALGVLLVGNVGIGRAADYQDANSNICGGPNCFTGNLIADGAEFNVAFGPNMMNSLTSGSFNDAFGSGALADVKDGDDNIGDRNRCPGLQRWFLQRRRR